MFQRSHFCLTVALLLLASFSAEAGLVSQHGKALPKPTAGYIPKETLPFPVAQVYKAAVAVLDEDGASILNQDKEDGRIATDYIPGPSFTAAGGLLGSNTLRYKYLINIKEAGQGSKVKVTAHLESSGNKIQSWRDIGDINDHNRAAVADLENALIEQIEKQLMP